MAVKRTRSERLEEASLEAGARKRSRKAEEDAEDEGGQSMAPPKPKAKRAAPKRAAAQDAELTPLQVEEAKALADTLLDSVHQSWRDLLESILKGEEGCRVLHRLNQISKGKNVFPPSNLILRAFALTSFEDTKAVILGQDPYHREGQAMGLAFSVPQGVAVPPSLKKIYEEIGVKDHKSGDLTSWASQGVLLLNPVLTVEAGKPNSHEKVGWKAITDAVLQKLSASHPKSLVFMLWGQKAQAKAPLIDESRHLVLKAAHPSPLATKGGFVGCGHFKQCNEHLEKNGERPIDWRSILTGKASPPQAPPAVPTSEGDKNRVTTDDVSRVATLGEEVDQLTAGDFQVSELQTEPAISPEIGSPDEEKEAMTEPALPHYDDDQVETEPTDTDVLPTSNPQSA